jgi:hypothetical protein
MDDLKSEQRVSNKVNKVNKDTNLRIRTEHTFFVQQARLGEVGKNSI